MRSGNLSENKVRRVLKDLGYLVGSTRHTAGPGDHIAVSPMVIEPAGSDWIRHMQHPPLLIEVKGTLQEPWNAGGGSEFGPKHRRELLDAALGWNVEPILAWCPPGLGGIMWLPPEDWPGSEWRAWVNLGGRRA